MSSADPPRSKRPRTRDILDDPLLPMDEPLIPSGVPLSRTGKSSPEPEAAGKKESSKLDLRVRERVCAPPPFLPARKEVYRGFKIGVSTYLSMPSKLTLVIAAAERLAARDFQGAAAVIPLLLRRFRRVNNYRWYFAREATIAGAEVLRRCETEGHSGILERFLATIMRDDGVGLVSGPGYGILIRETALLELLVELAGQGRVVEARETVREEIKKHPFSSSALIQGYFGMLSLAVMEATGDTSVLRDAAEALETAAKFDPEAYCFTHYAAACAFALGEAERGISLLRKAVEANESDPFAVAGLLEALRDTESKECTFSGDTQEELVSLARKLLVLDPVSKPALNLLNEAHRGDWAVSPPVEILEIALAYAGYIERGYSQDCQTWNLLSDALSKASPSNCRKLWTESGRCGWWPSYYFRKERAAADCALSRSLASVKCKVASYLDEELPYVKKVESILSKR